MNCLGQSLGMVGMIKIILEREGLSGFYNGVKTVMVGQALIKAVAFGSNNWALEILSNQKAIGIVEVTKLKGIIEFIFTFNSLFFVKNFQAYIGCLLFWLCYFIYCESCGTSQNFDASRQKRLQRIFNLDLKLPC